MAGWRRRLAGSEHGQAAIELAVIMPVVLTLVLLGVQYALVLHAKQVADAAADHGAAAAAASQADTADGRVAARRFTDAAGALKEVAVAIDRTDEQVSVQVTGTAPRLVPLAPTAVRAAARQPVERFIAEPDRR